MHVLVDCYVLMLNRVCVCACACACVCVHVCVHMCAGVVLKGCLPGVSIFGQ